MVNTSQFDSNPDEVDQWTPYIPTGAPAVGIGLSIASM
jgi:hypothetical protein